MWYSVGDLCCTCGLCSRMEKTISTVRGLKELSRPGWVEVPTVPWSLLRITSAFWGQVIMDIWYPPADRMPGPTLSKTCSTLQLLKTYDVSWQILAMTAVCTVNIRGREGGQPLLLKMAWTWRPCKDLAVGAPPLFPQNMWTWELQLVLPCQRFCKRNSRKWPAVNGYTIHCVISWSRFIFIYCSW